MALPGTKETQIDSHLALVVGVDGSGKSTFLNHLSASHGYCVLEPTSTAEARQFKSDNLETPVDSSFIDSREELYIGLNDSFDDTIRAELDESRRVATTGARIVTQLSHAVMRDIVEDTSGNHDFVDRVVNEWLASDSLKPDVLVLVHAPTDVILGRIGARQAQGDSNEKFWGFNSPFFLYRYQDAWLELAETIQASRSISSVVLDSGEICPEKMILRYVAEVLEDR